MPGDGDLALSLSPDIMAPPMASKSPPELAEPLFEISALHTSSFTLLCVIVKRPIPVPALTHQGGWGA